MTSQRPTPRVWVLIVAAIALGGFALAPALEGAPIASPSASTPSAATATPGPSAASPGAASAPSFSVTVGGGGSSVTVGAAASPSASSVPAALPSGTPSASAPAAGASPLAGAAGPGPSATSGAHGAAAAPSVSDTGTSTCIDCIDGAWADGTVNFPTATDALIVLAVTAHGPSTDLVAADAYDSAGTVAPFTLVSVGNYEGTGNSLYLFYAAPSSSGMQNVGIDTSAGGGSAATASSASIVVLALANVNPVTPIDPTVSIVPESSNVTSGASPTSYATTSNSEETVLGIFSSLSTPAHTVTTTSSGTTLVDVADGANTYTYAGDALVTSPEETYPYSFYPTASDGNRIYLAVVLLPVEGLPSASVAPSSPSIDDGQALLLTADVAGGSGGYTDYQWYFDTTGTDACGAGGSSPLGTAATQSTSGGDTSLGANYFCFTVEDHDANAASSAQDLVTVNPELATPGTPTVATPIHSGEVETVTLDVSSVDATGTPPITYALLASTTVDGTYADTGASCADSSGALSCAYTPSIGNYFYEVMATDSSAAGAATATTAVPSGEVTVSGGTAALSPATGPPGTNVTITGSGFADDTTYNDCFEAAGTPSACADTHSFTTDGSGNIPSSTILVVPSSDNEQVVISGADSEVVAATDVFTPTTYTLVISPAMFTYNASVAYSGTGLAPSTLYDLYFDGEQAEPSTGTPMTVFTSSPSGDFSGSFTVPHIVGLYYADLFQNVSGVPSSFIGSATTPGSGMVVVEEPELAIVGPQAGPAGTTYVASGGGYSLNSGLTLYFNDGAQTPSSCTDGTFNGTTVTADYRGIFTCNFIVPSLPAGSYVAYAVDLATNDPSNEVGFTITTPSIVVSVPQGPTGATYFVTGTGFSQSATAHVDFDGTAQVPTACSLGSWGYGAGTSITTSNVGSFDCTFQAPALSAGSYPVVGLDVSSGAESASPSFEITTPTISLSAAQGPANAPYTVTATGFSISSGAALSFGGVARTPSSCSVGTFTGTAINTSNAGTFTCTFAVPADSAAPYPIVGVDTATSNDSNIVDFTLTTLTLALDTPQGPATATLSLSGSGFSVSSTVDVDFGGSTLSATSCATGTLTDGVIDSNASGEFACEFIVPIEPPQTYGIEALDVASGGYSNSVEFELTVPMVGLTPSTGVVGDTVTISGSGFALTDDHVGVRGTIVPGGLLVCSLSAGSIVDGCDFTVMSAAAGEYLIDVAGDRLGDINDTATTVFNLTVPSIQLDPTAGVGGESVAVTGSGFALSDLQVLIVGTPVGGSGIYCSVSGGAISGTCTFTIAEGLDASAYTITANGTVSGGGDTAEATLDVSVPSILLGEMTGHVGDVVTVTGSGFSPADVSVAFSTGVSETFSCGLSDGTITGSCQFTVVPTSGGTYTVTGVGNVVGSEGDTATAQFLLVAQLTITSTPLEGSAGQLVSITGSGFTHGATVAFELGLAAVTCQEGGTINTDGSLDCQFAVPIVVGGAHPVNATDVPDGTVQSTNEFTVLANFTASIYSGGVGNVFTITGNGYTDSESIQTSFLGVTILMPTGICTLGSAVPATGYVNATANGQFSCSFVVPDVSVAFYLLTAGPAIGPWVFSVTEPVTFSTTTLPSWEEWYVDLSGTGCVPGVFCTLEELADRSIVFELPNGTYTYTVSSNLNYFGPDPATNSLTVAGSSSVIDPVGGADQTVIFHAYLTTATFFATGLPVWESWFINLTSPVSPPLPSTESNGSPSVPIELFNGSYTYHVASGALYFGPGPASGSFTIVYNTGVSATIAFRPYTTAVTFSSASLPSWESWFLNLTAQNGTVLPSQSSVGGTNFDLELFNGTYGFAISSGTRYYGPNPASGSVSVTYASPLTRSIAFHAYTTAVTFSTTGLPVLESWFLNLTAQNGTALPSERSVGGSELAFEFFNGTYAYTVASGAHYYAPSPSAGSVDVVYGTPQSRSTTFRAVTETVTFSTTIPTSGESWFVNATADLEQCGLAGATCVEQSSSGTISLVLFNGSYTFTVTSGGMYYAASPGTGSIGVTGSGADPSSVAVAWTAEVYWQWYDQSGIPANETWTINATSTPSALCSYAGGQCRGLSSSGSVALQLFNGTYTYVVQSGGMYFKAYPGSGSIPIDGETPSQINVYFTLVTNAVTFSESGLPSGTTWALSGSSTYFATTLFFATAPGTLTAYSTNGTFTFEIQDVPGWHLSSPAYAGAVGPIDGNPATGPDLEFYQFAYPVTWTESGLPVGATWGVALNGTLYFNATGDQIVVSLPNGTFDYAIQDVAGWHQSTIAYSGAGTVDGAPVSTYLLFTAVTYSVTIGETGIASGVTWTFVLNGMIYAEVAPNTIFAQLPNGTYTYQIGDVPGWHLSSQPYSGTGTVAGAPVNLLLDFMQVTYALTLAETGLPAGMVWTVTLNGTIGSAVSPGTISAQLPNGTYDYQIGDVQGWHQTTLPYTGTGEVHGGASTVTVTFTQVRYAITFSEGGLPIGTKFQLVVNGTTVSAVAPNPATTELPNGTFTFQVQDVAGWHQTTVPYTVQTAQQGPAGYSLTLAFTQVTYTVTFTETGLPNGVWEVTVNGTLFRAPVGDPITDPLPNGTFTYAISDYAGYHQTTLPYAGSGRVSGAPLTEPTLLFAVATYTVTFTESGLPSGATWTAMLGNQSASATGSTVLISGIANGSYAFSAAATGFTASPASGNLTVTGPGAGASIAFTAAAGLYTVSFTETGIPMGLGWSVTFGGTTEIGTSPTPIVFLGVTNGAYDWSVTNVGAYYPWPSASGSVTVSGASQVVALSYGYAYAVTITQTGIANGTTWMTQVTQLLTNTTGFHAESASSSSAFMNSTGPSVIFHLANGTFSYTITAPGYQSHTSSFQVAGAALRPPTATISATSSTTSIAGWLWVVIAVVVIVVIAGLVVLLVRKKPGRPIASWAPGPSAPSPPGSAAGPDAETGGAGTSPPRGA